VQNEEGAKFKNGDVVDVIYNGSWFEAEVPFATYL